MSWLNPALLMGLGLVTLPVILHLLFRVKPKQLPFPALRLLVARQVQNRRRLQIRHWWLLLLRMAVIAAVVLAVARPMLPAADYRFTMWEWGVLVVVIAGALFADVGWVRWRTRSAVRKTISPGLPIAAPRTTSWLDQAGLRRGSLVGMALLMITLLVLWPWQSRVRAELSNPRPTVNAQAPVAAVLVFDTSPSMSYTQQGKTRLAIAQELARRWIGQLPSGSRVGVIQSGDDLPTVLSADVLATENRLSALSVQLTPRTLDERIEAAIRALDDDRRRVLGDQAAVAEERRQDRYVREVYVLTDLARSGWRLTDPPVPLVVPEWLSSYVIDVGAEAPVNTGFVRLNLPRENVPAGTSQMVGASLRKVGGGASDVTVELRVRRGAGAPVKVAQQTVSVSEEAGAAVRLPLEISKESFVQGELRIVGSDPLELDDTLPFTIGTLAPVEVLVVADREDETDVVVEGLRSLNSGQRAALTVKTLTTAQLSRTDAESAVLKQVDMVLLLQARSPSAASWDKLKDFVSGGGGLLVCLGAASTGATTVSSERAIDPLAYRVADWLPGKPLASLRFLPAATLDLRGSGHGLVQQLELSGAVTELSVSEIRRYWTVDPAMQSRLILRYNDARQSPAMLERSVGNGRVVLLTTSLDSLAWNDLPASWTYLALLDQTVQLLSRQGTRRLNWELGAAAVWPAIEAEHPAQMLLRHPDVRQQLLDWPATQAELALGVLTTLGNSQLADPTRPNDLAGAFSTTLPANECDLTRLGQSELEARFGEGRVALARDIASLERTVALGRIGQEMSGVLLALLVGVFLWEQLTAAWFYASDAPPPAVTGGR